MIYFFNPKAVSVCKLPIDKSQHGTLSQLAKVNKWLNLSIHL